MARADALTIASGVPSMTLMENAAAAITRTANQILQKSSGRRVLVLCGPGNNGGDGYVAARLLRSARIKVKVAALTPREQLRGDALAAALAWDGSVEPAESCSFSGVDLVVDALFGSGLARDIEGPAAELVTRLNRWRRESGQHVVAVDMPSGIDGTTGAVRGVAVEADATVTFFRLKSGHLLLPGRLHCGALACAHIAIRSGVLAGIGPDTFVNAPGFWLDTLPFPGVEGHKYTRGHAVVVSGGASFTGAARLAAAAALRAGAGLVTLASPADAMAVNAAALTSVMLREAEGAAGLAALLGDARKNVVAMGPGLGVSAATREKALTALSSGSASRAFVLDADALTSFSDAPENLWRAIKAAPGPVVLTPHAGEFARMFRPEGRSPSGAPLSKLDKARAAARESGAILLVQGAGHGHRGPGRPRDDFVLCLALAGDGGFGRHIDRHYRRVARPGHGAAGGGVLRRLDARARRRDFWSRADRRRYLRDAAGGVARACGGAKDLTFRRFHRLAIHQRGLADFGRSHASGPRARPSHEQEKHPHHEKGDDEQREHGNEHILGVAPPVKLRGHFPIPKPSARHSFDSAYSRIRKT